MLGSLVRRPDYVWQMDTPLLRLSARDPWRLRDAFEGVQIMGATGSGKTSGSGQAIAHAFLRAGMGGLVLCAKPGERELWQRYARECGRERSLIIFDGSGTRRMNFMQYELGRATYAHMLSMNAVRMLLHILDVAEGSDNQQTGGDPFWRQASVELLSNAVSPLWHAWGRVTLRELMLFISDRPKKLQDVGNTEWMEGNFWHATMNEIAHNPAYPMDLHDFTSLHQYWTKTMASGDKRLAGNVVSTLSAKLAPLLSGRMREIFCTTTNIVPELTHEGCIIIMDMPIKEFAHVGIMAQGLMKYLWQRATERRACTDKTRPVFLWADECQFFLSPYDAEFQSTARSSRACTVYITQNLPTYYDRIGSRRPEHTADALLGNFQTKIFHNNSCPKTNQWAADIIGKSIQLRGNASQGLNEGWNNSEQVGENLSTNYGENRSSGSNWGWNRGSGGGSSSSPQGGSRSSHHSYGTSGGSNSSTGTSAGKSQGWNKGNSQGRSGGTNESRGFSETIDYELQASEFTRLATGGDDNFRRVEAVMYQGGRRFLASRSTWLPIVIRQT